MTDAVWQVRNAVTGAIRSFFVEQGYKELEVPLLAAALPQESYLEVFATELKTPEGQSFPAYLTTSPESFLKRLLAAGWGSCFCLTRSFRNQESWGCWHNPEFTLLEWYQVGANYKDLMSETEALVRVCQQAAGRVRGLAPDSAWQYQGQPVSLGAAWERLSVAEAFTRYAHLDLTACLDEQAMRQEAAKKGFLVDLSTTWEQLFHQIFLNEVEPHLGAERPTILYDYPPALAALAKTKAEPPHWAERFEVYVAGIELGDCYSELTNAQEMARRFAKEKEARRSQGKVDHPTDKALVEAVKNGLPECSGMALGVDRLVMLLADADDIAKTMFFPAQEVFGAVGY